MLYKWKLKNTESNFTIHKGEVEASTQEEALKIVNEEFDIRPHVGEILEIIAPDEITDGLDPTILT